MTCTGLGRHLRSCTERRRTIEQIRGRSGANGRHHHLQVRDGYGLGYWLHFEMNGNATLSDLDYYLRQIWLECCGHLSQFTIKGLQFAGSFGDPFGFEDSESLEVEADEVFAPGLTFKYEYDFGTTTELAIRVLDQRAGKPTTAHAVALMARNDLVPMPCVECGKPAQLICLDCWYKGGAEAAGQICRDHLAVHAGHDNYGQMPIFNSPRSGVCGYDGPAEPPY